MSAPVKLRTYKATEGRVVAYDKLGQTYPVMEYQGDVEVIGLHKPFKIVQSFADET